MRALLSLVTVGVVAVAALLTPAPARGAQPPPPVSNLRVYARYDHTLRLSWSVPAAAYHPDGTVVVRMTRGYTPAASPTAGYAVPFLRYATAAQARPLTAGVAYTFAVWVRDGTAYSARRTVTASTRMDVTPPGDLASVSNGVTITGAATASARLTFAYRGSDPDIAGVRVVRNTVRTTTGGTVLFVPGQAQTFTDPMMLARNTRYYYWALPRDTSGHYAQHYVATTVDTTFRRISGHYTHNDLAPMDPPFVLATTGEPAESGGNSASGAPDYTWYEYVRPGRYTVCQNADNAPDQHFFFVSGCWTPQGIADYESEVPPAAIGAVDATAADVTGVDLYLNYH